ncbi:hypothetical protein MMC25_005046 [Agyrium rufum]|nr:hypothetical protein [Agyrium rufum]
MTRFQATAPCERELQAQIQNQTRRPVEVRSLRELANLPLPDQASTTASDLPASMRFPEASSSAASTGLFDTTTKKKNIICITADLLIPGRGEPTKNAATVLEDNKIVFVGSQASLPEKYATVPRVHVPVLMPGLWDCHTHFMGDSYDVSGWLSTPPATAGARIARSFHEVLMAGFTSVRDVGSHGIEAHKAVEEGIIYGPTLYGAGAAISQTAGHGDQFELPVGWVWDASGVHRGENGRFTGSSVLCIADGVDECRKAIRLQIRRGAKLIKILASGGVLSRDDDPMFQQFSDEELKVMVDEAGRMNRIVAAHVHGKAGVLAAIRAGCKTLEHGSYIDDECIDAMHEKGVMLVATRTIVNIGMAHLDLLGPEQRAKMIQVNEINKKNYRHAVSRGIKCALGTDLGSSALNEPFSIGQNAIELVYAVEDAGMTPLQAIEAGTANGPDTLGPMAPMSGQIKEGYDADVIALSANPVEDITVFKDRQAVTHVWKGGKMVKGPVLAVGMAFP